MFCKKNEHFYYRVDKKQSEEIRKKYGKSRRGFGSFPVEVTLGKMKWKTSIFPSRKDGACLLPLKAEVRRKEEIMEGDTVSYSIEIKV